MITPVSISSNLLLASLSPTDVTLLLPHLSEILLDQSLVLQAAEVRVERVFFPLSGMVSLVTIMQSGTAVETAIVGREGVIGAFAGLGPWNAFTQAVVQLPGRGLAIAASRFQEVVSENERIRDLVLRYKESLLGQVQQTAACNALHSLECRLARWLLQAHDRIEGPRLDLTQELLSQMLGVRRTSVTMTATKLEQTGLIRQRRAAIEIVDRKGLEEAACECYAAIRLRSRPPLPYSAVSGATAA
jgi:CRP-like cAMP-binding protein